MKKEGIQTRKRKPKAGTNSSTPSEKSSNKSNFVKLFLGKRLFVNCALDLTCRVKEQHFRWPTDPPGWIVDVAVAPAPPTASPTLRRDEARIGRNGRPRTHVQ